MRDEQAVRRLRHDFGRAQRHSYTDLEQLRLLRAAFVRSRRPSGTSRRRRRGLRHLQFVCICMTTPILRSVRIKLDSIDTNINVKPYDYISYKLKSSSNSTSLTQIIAKVYIHVVFAAVVIFNYRGRLQRLS
jgi:hypothetical protein